MTSRRSICQPGLKLQDVAAGMLALPQGMHNCLLPEVVNILLCLESVTRVMFCHHCYLPGAACRCLGVTSMASAPSMATGL